MREESFRVESLRRIDGTVLLQSLQWLAFLISSSLIMPLVLGQTLGLDARGVADFVQRTFLVSGAFSIIQAVWGHRMPILEGQSGMWLSVIITLSTLAPALGTPLGVLRQNLEMALMVTGALLILLAATRLIAPIARLFTPPVTGVFLILLAVQVGGPFIGSMLGVSEARQQAEPVAIALSVGVLLVIGLVSLLAAPGWRTFSILIGLTAGWLAAAVAGLTAEPPAAHAALLSLPEIFPFGPPLWNTGVVLTAVLTGLLVLSNFVASVVSMGQILGEEPPAATYNRAMLVTGGADVVAGVTGLSGFIPFTTAVGFVALTGMTRRLPFILASALLLLLGLLPPLGMLAATIPAPVSNAALLVVFAQLFGLGVRDLGGLDWGRHRAIFVAGLPVLVGVGLMMLPASAWVGLPPTLRYFLGNGFMVGTLFAAVLEQVIPGET